MKLKNIIYTAIAATALSGTHCASTGIIYEENKRCIYCEEKSFLDCATEADSFGLTTLFLIMGIGPTVAYFGWKNNQEWENMRKDKEK